MLNTMMENKKLFTNTFKSLSGDHGHIHHTLLPVSQKKIEIFVTIMFSLCIIALNAMKLLAIRFMKKFFARINLFKKYSYFSSAF